MRIEGRLNESKHEWVRNMTEEQIVEFLVYYTMSKIYYPYDKNNYK